MKAPQKTKTAPGRYILDENGSLVGCDPESRIYLSVNRLRPESEDWPSGIHFYTNIIRKERKC